MGDQFVKFESGASYEPYMGKWSQLVGESFIRWLAPKQGLRWLDVGCGNGAFTEMIVERCAPSAVHGIDPSEGQLAFARKRSTLHSADLRQADAMALPYTDNSIDVAVMPLVIFFVPDPAKGVSEMKRVVCPGGIVSAYSWDMVGGGFPYEALHDELRRMNSQPAALQSIDASRIDVMRELWSNAGLKSIETKQITVQRTYADFEDYWSIIQGGPSVRPQLATMTPQQLAQLKDRMQARLPVDKEGRITCSGQANAIKGVCAD